MATDTDKSHPATASGDSTKSSRPKRSRRRKIFTAIACLAIILFAVRLAAAPLVRWYVNRVLDSSKDYQGRIGAIDINLWRGAYTIHDIRFVKTTANVPVPLFSARQLDLSLEWHALLHGKLVGRIDVQDPELNFVADKDNDAANQTGAGGPWLMIVRDLFPFQINSFYGHNASIHFHSFATDPPVDVYLSQLEFSVENLTNVNDDITPLIATVKAHGLAMDQAQFEYDMHFNPFSYKPTFNMAVRLLGLDVLQINSLTRAYGAFDFERGWFSLVIDLKSTEGQLDGYVKPLFRNVKVFSLKHDIPDKNVLQVFWEALIGTTFDVLKNQSKDQLATVIPITGSVDSAKEDILATVANILRNAFIRAYLPRLEGGTESSEELEFGPGAAVDPATVDTDPHGAGEN